MKKKIFLIGLLLLGVGLVHSQTDYSDKWEDYYSYNAVKYFQKTGNVVRAIVDNSAFTYNLSTQQVSKLSSVNGLSGGVTSAMYYSSQNAVFVIGYEDGVLELILDNGTIKKFIDITISDVSNLKKINAIYEFDNKLYLSMQFGIVVFDLIKQEFSDTYFIGDDSSEVDVNDILIDGSYIYATSDNGIYIADITSNLNDFENWNLNFSGVFAKLRLFNNEVLVSQGKTISKIVDRLSLELKITTTQDVKDFNTDQTNLIVGGSTQAKVYNSSFSNLYTVNISSNTMNSVSLDSEGVYLGTQLKGLLSAKFSDLTSFTEIHPEGPNSNDIFSITTHNNHLWIVYGGYNISYGPTNTKKNISHYDQSSWVHIPYSSFRAQDLVNVTVDPNNEHKVYISSWGQTNGVNSNLTGGVLVIEDNNYLDFWNNYNTPLEEALPDASSYVTVRIDGTAFDNQGNFWVSNSLAPNSVLKKRAIDGTWSSHNLSVSGLSVDLNQLIVDREDNIWIGSRKLGLLGYSSKNDVYTELKIDDDKGALPSNNVRTVAADNNGNIWIGTSQGLVVFRDVANVFESDFDKAEPVIIIDNDIPEKLLGDSTINSILIDGANNKWFGTSTGGVVHTNSTGKETLNKFSIDNSPLPSNFIKKIKIDNSTGKVYFLTDRGIVAYNSDLAPYGEELTKVYAFPNPALKHHDKISIVGKDGANLPTGTNVKILDVSGNLVFESNTIEGQSQFGGKIVWNKKNLSGTNVASGIYIVLLFNAEGNQTSTTKIAIVN
ncbi:two-component regulator propeller domain-containing protein [Bacteroidota bacterium]